MALVSVAGDQQLQTILFYVMQPANAAKQHDMQAQAWCAANGKATHASLKPSVTVGFKTSTNKNKHAMWTCPKHAIHTNSTPIK